MEKIKPIMLKRIWNRNYISNGSPEEFVFL